MQGCAGLSSQANLIEVQMSSGFGLRCELHFVHIEQHLETVLGRKELCISQYLHHQCLYFYFFVYFYLADGQNPHCIKQRDIIYPDV